MIIKEMEKAPTWVRMSALGSGDKSDPIKTAELMLENAMRPKLEEPALVHPFNTSIIKIRNNGMIDMFVGTDQGIRLDPYSKTINEIIDGLKWHVGYFKGWIDKDAEWYANGNILFKSESSAVTLSAKTDVSIVSGRNIKIKCDGELSFSAAGGVNIDTGGAFKMNGTAVNISCDDISLGKGASQQSKKSREYCPTSGEISTGSTTVMIDGMPAARVGDKVTLS